MKSKNETLRISLFFDGGNNDAFDKNEKISMHTNASAPVAEHDILQSNIYRLYSNIHSKRNAFNKSIYIGGGNSTTSGSKQDSDSITDFDPYEVNSKTNIAFRNLIDILKEFSAQHKEVTLNLKIDLFGFSVGAALARNFANLLHSNRTINDDIASVLCVHNNILKGISFGFIGLFDGIKTDFGGVANAKINLDLNEIKADATFHLTALHEFRENFSLLSVTNNTHYATSCNLDTLGSSSNRVTNTFEFAVPGSHKDIGGGCQLFEDENIIINTKPTYIATGLAESIQNLIDSNLLLSPLFAQMKFEYNIFRGGYTAVNYRKNIYGHLQLLYARLMVDTAVKFGVPFDHAKFEVAHPIPAELGYFFSTLLDCRDLLLNVKNFSSPLNVLEAPLVQKYVHLSAAAKASIAVDKRKIKISLLGKTLTSRKSFSFLNSAAAM